MIADQVAVNVLCNKWLRKDAPKRASPAGSRRKRNSEDSAADFALACDLVRENMPREEIEAGIREKMVAEGRGDTAARADYLIRTINSAKRAVEADPKRPSMKAANKIIAIELERFELGCTPKRGPFAVDKLGPNVAIPLDTEAVKDLLSDLYFDAYDGAAGSSAIAEALSVLRGKARRSQSTKLAVRYARHGSGVVADLGGVDGRAVMIEPTGWRILERSPVIFSRSKLIIEVHPPSEGIDIGKGLWSSERSSTRVTTLTSLSAGSPVGCARTSMTPSSRSRGIRAKGSRPRRRRSSASSPRALPPEVATPNLETYSLTVAGAWPTLIENSSNILDWMSDAMCRTMSGDSFVRRKLHTDQGLSIVNFRRVIGMATIDGGALKADLADRVLEIELQPIDESETIGPAELAARIDNAIPKLVGVFYTLVSKVLASLPSIELDKMPRMADFAAVLAVLDQIRGTESLGAYLRHRDHLAGDVLEGDIVGNLVQNFMENRTFP